MMDMKKWEEKEIGDIIRYGIKKSVWRFGLEEW
jgi:hypothetical protein